MFTQEFMVFLDGVMVVEDALDFKSAEALQKKLIDEDAGHVVLVRLPTGEVL